MSETRAGCKNCQNRTDEKPPFCVWLKAEMSVGLADDSTCEGFVRKGLRTNVGKGSRKATSVKGDDESVGGAETSVDKPPKTTSYPKTDSASALILKALEFKNFKGRIYWEKVRCCKRNCRCSRGSPHGPYAYLRFSEAGRWRKRYLGKDLAVLMSKTREELEARLSQVDEILGQGSPSGSRPSETAGGI